MADISTASFDGNVFPSDISQTIIDLALQGMPVFDALTRRTTSNGSVVFGIGSPTGFDWTPELGEIPAVEPGDEAVVAVPCKISGTFALSFESIADAGMPLQQEMARIIAGSMAARADHDLVYGAISNPAGPTGFYDALTNVPGSNLREAVVQAAADMMSEGGRPSVAVISPALWAQEVTRREATSAASGLLSDLGIPLDVRIAATLDPSDALLLDKSAVFGVLRDDLKIDYSFDAPGAWDRDAVAVRVRARLAAVVPAPSKSARSISILTSP